MTRRNWTAVVALMCGAVVLTWGLNGLLAKASGGDEPAKAPAKAPAAKETPGKSVFDLTKVWAFHLEISAKEYQAMQPAGGGMGFPGLPGGPGKPPPKPPEKPGETPRDSDRSAFGVEFPWVHGEFMAEGKTYKNVGLRYKGNSTFMATSRNLKRSLKIELDHYDDTLAFHGLKTLNLHCEVMDPSRGREVLAYAVFRAAGVPAPRTAFAEVTMTVPGKYEKEYVGLYTVVEQVDKRFLKDRFKNDKGLLVKPEGMRSLDYLGEDWEKYRARYRPRHEPTKEEAKRLIEFIRLINQADDEQFQKEIGSYLDVDRFLRFLAANALVVNMDSFFTLGHNYYLYLNPATKKFVFIPWDLDLSVANFAMMGSPEQLMDLSLTRPYGGTNKLTDRLLAIKGVNEKYQQILKDLAADCFSKERLLKDIEAIEKVTKEPIDRETKAVAARKEASGGFGFGPMMGRSMDLRTFVEKRTASVADQLAGKSKGFVPAGFGFGAPGGAGGRPGGFGMGNFFAKPVLEALDADKDGKVKKDELTAGARKFFTDTDKDSKNKLDETALATGLSRLFPQPQGFARPAGPGPGTRPAQAIAKRAGKDKDGMVTLEAFMAAAEALFVECDKDKNGSLDEKEVAAGIDLLMPPPPAFGKPLPMPEEPKKEDKKEEKKP